MSATATKVEVSIATLEDRYEALLYDYRTSDPSKLQWKLWKVTRELISGVSRVPRDDDGLFGGVNLQSLIEDDIRAAIIRRVAEAQIAE